MRTGYYWKRIGLWAALAAGLGLVGFVACVLGLALPDLTRNIPVPECVKRFENEAAPPNQPSQHAAKPKAICTTETLAQPDGLPSYASLIPDRPDLPAAVKARRVELDAEYQHLLADMKAYLAGKTSLSYEQARARLDAYRLAQRTLFTKISRIWGPEPSRAESPAHLELRSRFRDSMHQRDKEYREMFVRHGQWRAIAEAAEWDAAHWDEAVYYWRRCGGFYAHWRIAAGAIERKLPDGGMFSKIKKRLPYPDPVQMVAN